MPGPRPLASRAAPGTTFGLALGLALGLAVLAPAVHLEAQDPPARPADPGSVRGQVVNAETGRPLSFADLVILRVGADPTPGGAAPGASGTVVARGESGAEGRFSIGGLPPGEYVLEARTLGYLPATSSPFRVGASGVADLGVLRLEWEVLEVEGVSVELERPEVTYESDRNVYHMESNPIAMGGSATDALSAVNELDVDVDGRVEFEGRTPEIYINGRPAPMQGEALTAFLDQLPGEMIERIEVIANPSARFAAEGSGGIVNIVLKRDRGLGLTGNAFANAGTRGDARTGGRLGYQTGPWTLQLGTFLRRSDRVTESFDLRQNLRADPATFRRQDRDSWAGSLGAGGDGSVEYRLRENVILRGEGRLDLTDSDSRGSTLTSHFDALMDPTGRYDRFSDSDRDRSSNNGELGFEWNLGRTNHDLTGSVSADRGRNLGLTLLEIREELFFRGENGGLDPEELELEELLALLPPDFQLRDERERTAREQLRLDYTRPWGEGGRFELGYRGDFRLSEEDRKVFSDPDGVGLEETVGFRHRENLHSGYLTLGRRFTTPAGPLAFQGGLRAERAEIRFTVPGQVELENGYTRLFPSLSLSLQPSQGRQLRLSYSQRIRRPGVRFINPVDRSTDPLTRSVGNPELNPQYAHSVRLDGRISGQVFTFQVAPSYQLTTNDWVEIRTVDTQGVAVETWDNLGSSQRFGTAVTLSARPSPTWNSSLRVSGSRDLRDGGPTALDNGWTSMNWAVRGSGSVRVSPTLNLQGQVNWSPAREVPRGWVPHRVMTQAGVRWRILEGRGSLNLNLRDPFDWYDASMESRDPTHVQTGGTRVSRRSATLGFTWSFVNAASQGGGARRGGGR